MSNNTGPTKIWSRLLGSRARAVTVGADGYVYVAGSTDGNIDGQTNSGSTDIFIAKYSVDGTKVWTKLLGTSSTDEAWALTTANDGSVYVAGRTSGNLDGQTSNGNYDANISKYSSDGSKVWTRLWGQKSFDKAYALATGLDGSIYMAGDIDPGTTFLKKYSPDGSEGWTTSLGSGASDYARALTIGSDGAIYLAGQTGGNLDGQTNSRNGDSFVARYNTDGSRAWARLLGTSENDSASAMATGADGSIYVAGFSYGSLDGQFNNGSQDGFLTKYSPEGTRSWTRLVGTSKNDFVTDLSIGVDGAIYLSGITYGNLDGQINNGVSAGFLMRFNPDGTKSWSRLVGTSLIGTSSGYEAHSVATGLDGAIYLAGSGDGDPFLIKWIDPDTTAPAVALSTNKAVLKAGETAAITFSLTELSTDFALDDIGLSGGTLSSFTGSSTSYTATFTPHAGSIANGVVSVASGKFSDAAGNLNVDGADANNRVTIAIDTVLPTISVTSSKTSLKGSETATISFALSEASTDFIVGDISFSGGTLSDFTGSGAAYTAKFIPDSNSTANGIVSVASGKFSDAAGNYNADGSSMDNMVQLDRTAAALVGVSPSNGSNNVAPGTDIVLEFSEPVIRGSGYLEIRRDSKAGNIVERFDISESSRLSIEGGRVIIDPQRTLPESTNIFVVIPEGGIISASADSIPILTDPLSFYTGSVDNWMAPKPSKFQLRVHSIDVDDEGVIYLSSSPTSSIVSDKSPAVITQFSASGDQGWSREVAASYLWATKSDSSGSVYVGGQGPYQSGKQFAVIFKLDNLGNLIWSRNDISDAYTIRDIALGTDGSVYAFGRVDPPLSGGVDLPMSSALLKYSSTGTLLWSKVIAPAMPGTRSADGLRNLEVSSDNHLYLAWTEQTDDRSVSFNYVAKYDFAGNQVWRKQIGTGNDFTFCLTAVATDGSIFVSGVDTSSGSSSNGVSNSLSGGAFVAKLSPAGTVVWKTPISESEYSYTLPLITSDGQLIVILSEYNLANNNFGPSKEFLIDPTSGAIVMAAQGSVWSGALSNITSSTGLAALFGNSLVYGVTTQSDSQAKYETVVHKRALQVPLDGEGPRLEISQLAGSEIILTFSEPIILGSGYVFLRKGDAQGRIIQSFRLGDSEQLEAIGSSVVLKPIVRLTPNSTYCLTSDEAVFFDVDKNPVLNISERSFFKTNAEPSSALFDTFATLATYADFDRSLHTTGSGMIKGVPVAISGELTHTLVGETVFEGVKAFKYSDSLKATITINGQSSEYPDDDGFTFYDKKYLYLGSVSADSYEVVVDRTTYPTNFKVGDSFYEKSISYTDGSKKVVLDTTMENSSVVADTPGSALIQTSGTTTTPGGGVVSTSIQTTRVTPAGGSQPLGITVVSADGNTMAYSLSLGENPKTGHVYHWKSHVLMGGVGFDVTTGTSSATAAPRLIDFENIRVDPFSGDVTAEVWARATSAFGSVSLEFAHDSGLAFRFTADPTNLSDWQVVSNAAVDSTVLMAMGLRQLSGDQRLGSILMAAGTDGVGTRLSLVDSMLGSTPVRDVNLAISNPSGEYWVGSSTGSRALSLSKAPTGDATNAVTAADALAALKIASRVNPNTDPDGPGSAEPAPVSPYQLIAADVNGNGRVDADDALLILKMALRRSDAPETEWWFMRENRDFFDESTGRFSTDRKNAPLQRSGESVALSSDVNWVAVLKGDVDGSWSPDRNEIESEIPEPALQELALALSTSVTQWGLETDPNFIGS